MDKSCDEQQFEQLNFCDNTDGGNLDTLIGDMTNLDLQTSKLLPDETIGFPGPGSPTCGAGVGGTLKEYEDRLTALRKDNFNLKLRIYFLEERLQNSNAPQSHDDLYKKNLELKVKVGSLFRELKEHKNLLRSAAEAMEFTEQSAAKKEADLNKNIMELKIELENAHTRQYGGPLCEDSVALYTEAFNLNKIVQPKLQVNDKTLESSASSNPEENQEYLELKQKENVQIEKLKEENTKLYQLMQGCLERIKRMEKIEQKQKESLQRKEERLTLLQKELQQAGVQDVLSAQHSQDVDISLECEKIENKYKEMLLEKDNQIKELENNLNKVNMLQAQGDGRASVEMKNMNIQEILTKRLREMAYFLDSLISHRCVIGEEKQKNIEKLLEESLRLPVGLELDPEASRLLETSLMDNTMGDQSINILDLTRLLGHHVCLDDTQQQSWPASIHEHHAHNNSRRDIKTCRSVGELSSIMQDQKVNENNNQQKLQAVLQEKEEVLLQLDAARNKIITLETKWNTTKDEYESAIVNKQKQINKLYADIEGCHKELQLAKENNQQVMEQIKQLQIENTKLEEDKNKVMQNIIVEVEKETYKCKKVMEDQKIKLEAQKRDIANQKEEVEKQLQEMKREREEMEVQALEIQQHRENILRRQEEQAARGGGEEVCPSPDQGIDSDRHSSLELPDAYSSQDEIIALRSQLRETEEKLEAALHKLTPLQLRHHRVERAICKQIHKTTAVLREAKKNFNT